MKIILFGATGFVGTHLLRRLARDGHRLTVITRYRPGARDLALIPGVGLVQHDPYDEAGISSLVRGHDAVINLVGILNERGFSGRGFQRAHVQLTEILLAACQAGKIRRYLHMSALRAGQGESHYLRTKGEAEARIQDAAEAGWLGPTIFQPSTIFGPDDSFLNRFAKLLRISPVLPLARPDARFAPVYVGDVVEAFARALPRRDAIGQTYQLCGLEAISLRGVVTWLRDLLGLRRLVIGLPDWAGRLQGRVFDWVPGKPFSSDNFRSLKVDTVCTSNGLGRLGINPRSMRTLAPTWLTQADRQHRLGDFRRRASRVMVTRD